MTYQETLTFMYDKLPMYQRLGKVAYKNDLITSLQLDEHFGHPHNRFKSVHIAGTNGKGSVSHFLASILQSAGYKVGLYTSPHIKDFRERIKINGVMIPENEVIEFVEKNIQVFEELKPSFFEMNVALAFNYFANEQVDFAIIETGLGGRLDSTNIITPILSVITNIGFDHTEILGGTLDKIATEKAGIIKKGVPVVIGESQFRTRAVFNNIAKKQDAPITYADDYYSCAYSFITINQKHSFDIEKNGELIFENLITDLLGFYQRKNILTVLQSIDVLNDLNLNISIKDIYNGAENVAHKTGLKGRWQIISLHPTIVCDTGHNQEGIACIVEQINATPHKKLHFVFGVVNDKPIDEMLKILPKEGLYYFTKANIPRALDPNELAQKAACFGIKGSVYNSVNEALGSAKQRAEPNDLIFVGGSTFIVAEIL